MTSLKKLLNDTACVQLGWETQLESQLSHFETTFGVKSQEFYNAMMRGDLEEFDALDEYRMQFIEWLALYKTWLSFNQKYRQLIGRQPVMLQIKTNLEMSHA